MITARSHRTANVSRNLSLSSSPTQKSTPSLPSSKACPAPFFEQQLLRQTAKRRESMKRFLGPRGSARCHVYGLWGRGCTRRHAPPLNVHSQRFRPTQIRLNTSASGKRVSSGRTLKMTNAILGEDLEEIGSRITDGRTLAHGSRLYRTKSHDERLLAPAEWSPNPTQLRGFHQRAWN